MSMSKIAFHTTGLMSLPREIISHIGLYLEYQDRIQCKLASKVFASIHESRFYHQKTFDGGNLSTTNINKLIAYVKREKPKIEILSIVCKNIHEFNEACLLESDKPTMDFKLMIEIYNCMAIDNIIKYFNSYDVHEYLISHLKSDQIIKEPLLSEKIRISMFDKHLDMLNNKEFSSRLTLLNMNILYSDQNINLEHVPDSCEVLINTTHSTLSCNQLEKINTISYAIGGLTIIYLSDETIEKFKTAVNMQDIIIWDSIQLFSENSCWFKLAKVLPKKTIFHVYAGEQPNILSFIKRLKAINPNIDVFYRNDQSYLTCQMIKLIMPDVKTSAFYNPAWDISYTTDFGELDTKTKILEAMTPGHRMNWEFIGSL